MTKEEKQKLNRLYNRVVINWGVFIMSDKWYEETSYGKACLKFNSRLNELREVEEHLYTPYNLWYYGILAMSNDKVNRYINKLKFTNNMMGRGKTVVLEPRAETKEDKINDIKKKLPLTEAEFDNIKENTFLYYLSILDDKYRFTKLEKLYLMEYVLLRGEPNGKNDD